MKNVVVGILGIAGLAASASAAATWTTQIQYLVTGPAGSGYTGGAIASGGQGPIVTTAGVYSVTVQVGIFNMQGLGAGESNQGLFNWAGRAVGSGLTAAGDTYAVTNATSRITPFGYGPSTAFGGAVIGNNVIDGNSVTAGSLIQANRDVAGGASSVWAVGAPQPTGPTPGALGNDSFVSVFRFRITVGAVAGDNIVTTFSGSAGPVLGWSPFNVTPPDEELGEPGAVTFLGLTRGTSDGGPLAAYSASSFTLPRVPAPGSVALLGLGGLLAARRRRA